MLPSGGRSQCHCSGLGWGGGCGAAILRLARNSGCRRGAGVGKEGHGGLSLESGSLQCVAQGEAESPPGDFCT